MSCDEEGLWGPDVVIYHANCTDGAAACWVVHEAFPNREIEFRPGYYGLGKTNLEHLAGKNVLMVDFSLDIDEISRLKHEEGFAVKSLLILDHHETAIDKLGGIIPPAPSLCTDLCESFKNDGNVLAWFAEDCSSSMQAFMYFMNPHLINSLPHREEEAEPGGDLRPSIATMNRLIAFVSDFDIFTRNMRGVDEVNNLLKIIPTNIGAGRAVNANIWNQFAHLAYQVHYDLETCIEAGRAVERYKNQLIDSMMGQSSWHQFEGMRVPFTSCPKMLTTSLAHKQFEVYPELNVTVTYYDRLDGMREYSLRSRAGTEPTAKKIAMAYGGGGHEHAAGFIKPYSHLFINDKVDQNVGVADLPETTVIGLGDPAKEWLDERVERSAQLANDDLRVKRGEWQAAAFLIFIFALVGFGLYAATHPDKVSLIPSERLSNGD